MATVHALPTATTRVWAAAHSNLRDAVVRTHCPLLQRHLIAADAVLAESGSPSIRWAERMAAIEVTALRQAALSLSGQRRMLLLLVADAARELASTAARIHGVRPGQTAVAAVHEAQRGCFERV